MTTTRQLDASAALALSQETDPLGVLMRLIRALRKTTHSAGGAALGLSEEVAALNEGRGAHLAYDPEVRHEGAVDEDGGLR